MSWAAVWSSPSAATGIVAGETTLSGGSRRLGAMPGRTGYSKSSLVAMMRWPALLTRNRRNASAWARCGLEASTAAPEMFSIEPDVPMREVVERAVHRRPADLESQPVPVVLVGDPHRGVAPVDGRDHGLVVLVERRVALQPARAIWWPLLFRTRR